MFENSGDVSKIPSRRPLVVPRGKRYIACAVLRSAMDSYSRGLTILKGAVPGRTRGSGHMAPTYFVGSRGRKSDGSCGPHFIVYVLVVLLRFLFALRFSFLRARPRVFPLPRFFIAAFFYCIEFLSPSGLTREGT
jgi:hypothetical protein